MKPRFFFILCQLVVLYTLHTQAADTNLIVEITSNGYPDYMDCGGTSTNLIATGEWSRPISDGYGTTLRGRLLVYAMPPAEKTIPTDNYYTQAPAPVYLEIQDVTETNKNPIEIYFDVMNGLHFKLLDAKGAPADNLRPKESYYSISLRRPFWATLPAGGRLRLRVNAGVGGRADANLQLFFLDNGDWNIPAGDKHDYFLSATLLPFSTNSTSHNLDFWKGKADLRPNLATNSTPYNLHVWQGTLEIPAVKLGPSVLK